MESNASPPTATMVGSTPDDVGLSSAPISSPNTYPWSYLLAFGWDRVLGMWRAFRELAQNLRAVAARPSGWRGYWSARYGAAVARTLHTTPKILVDNQYELSRLIPRPFNEALDPIASAAEPRNRDGALITWRFSRSVVLDLFGPIGLVVGVLVLGAIGLSVAASFFDLPPLMASPAPNDRPQQSNTGKPLQKP